MSRTANAAAYICAGISTDRGRTLRRVNQLLYLSDWRHVLHHGEQLTDAHWHFGKDGPQAYAIQKALITDRRFSLTIQRTVYGRAYTVVGLNAGCDASEGLSYQDALTLRHILSSVSHLPELDLIKVVYNTKPIQMVNHYGPLDLMAGKRCFAPTWPGLSE